MKIQVGGKRNDSTSARQERPHYGVMFTRLQMPPSQDPQWQGDRQAPLGRESRFSSYSNSPATSQMSLQVEAPAGEHEEIWKSQSSQGPTKRIRSVGSVFGLVKWQPALKKMIETAKCATWPSMFQFGHIKTLISVVFVFLIVLLPYFFASSAAGSRAVDMEVAVRKALLTITSPNSAEEELWADHVVTSSDGVATTIDIPATFHSRLNSVLAPLMAEHAKDIWANTPAPLLDCKPPEVQVVSFSIQKSSRLPAVCTFGDQELRRSVRDIRDLRISFPQSSSRHMLRVQVAEERPALEGSDSSPRRYHLWGRFRGQILVDLSDTGKLALTRFCGESARDVDIEPFESSDVRLITVLELKRLYSLWMSKSLEKQTGRDSASLFRAVMTPTSHAPAHATIHAIRAKLKEYSSPFVNMTAISRNPTTENLRDTSKFDLSSETISTETVDEEERVAWTRREEPRYSLPRTSREFRDSNINVDKPPKSFDGEDVLKESTPLIGTQGTGDEMKFYGQGEMHPGTPSGDQEESSGIPL